MLRGLVVTLLLVSLADASWGVTVPLVLPDDAPLSAYEQQRLKVFQSEEAVNVSAVRLNQALFEADALTVSVNGETWMFLGARRDSGVEGIETWGGTSVSPVTGFNLVLTRGPSGISGKLDVPDASLSFFPMGTRSVQVRRTRVPPIYRDANETKR
jgi:hypothetical protein